MILSSSGAEILAASAMRRETCLYCEQTGVTTRLIPWGHWGLCPIHSADFIAKNTRPTIEAQMREKVGGYLEDKGRPTRNGVRP